MPLLLAAHFVLAVAAAFARTSRAPHMRRFTLAAIPNGAVMPLANPAIPGTTTPIGTVRFITTKFPRNKVQAESGLFAFRLHIIRFSMESTIMRNKKISGAIKGLWYGFLLVLKCSPSSMIRLAIVSSLLGLIAPINLYISQKLIDAIVLSIGRGEIQTAAILHLALISLLLIFSFLLSEYNALVMQSYSDKASLRVTDMLMSKINSLPMQAFDDANTYNKLRMANDETALRSLGIVGVVGIVIQSVIQLIGVSTIVFQTNLWIGTVAIIISIPAFALDCKIGERWHAIQKKRLEKLRYIDVLKEILVDNSSVKEVRLFGIGRMLKRRVINTQTEFNDTNYRTRFFVAVLNCTSSFGQNIVSFFLKLWLIIGGIAQSTSIGTISMLISSLDEFQVAVQSILTKTAELYESSLYIEYIKDIEKMPDENDSSLEELTSPIKSIVFEHVSFRYSGSDQYVLNDISLSLTAGKSYALVGFNGSGKTTLIKLVMKLYVPTEGYIYINGKDIRHFTGASICQQITAVFQDFIRYPFSVGENISLLNPTDEAGIERAAQYTNLHELIDRFPKKYETQLLRSWNEGTELSGGQWQKIAISRGVYRERNMLIFDEPFSALDALAEEDLVKKLKETKKEKLCIFVTHRYSSISMADMVVVLNNGCLEEWGSHRELMNSDGLYHRLFDAQTQPMRDLALSEIKFDDSLQ